MSSDKYDSYDSAMERDLNDQLERALEEVENGETTIYMNDDEFFQSLHQDKKEHDSDATA